MTGDFAPEIVVVNPDNMTIRWLTSESNHPTAKAWAAGDPTAMLL